MRRIATLLGILVAGGTVALVGPAPAFAANGTLTLNQRAHINPGPGCYEGPASNSGDLEINNNTDGEVVVYSGYSCDGIRLGSVSQRSEAQFEGSHSVKVP